MLPQTEEREEPQFLLHPLSNPPFPIEADELGKKSLSVNGGQSKVGAKKFSISLPTSPPPLPERETFPISSITKHEEGWVVGKLRFRIWERKVISTVVHPTLPFCNQLETFPSFSPLANFSP